MKCPKCRKEKDETEFKAKNNRIVKHCSACREMCKKWRAKNKERVKLYNKFSKDKTENDNLNWETIKKENKITGIKIPENGYMEKVVDQFKILPHKIKIGG